KNTMPGPMSSSISTPAICSDGHRITENFERQRLMKTILRAMLLIGALSGAYCVASMQARALVEIDVRQGIVEPLPIAVSDFISGDGKGAEISGVLEADLRRSGLFAPIEKGAFIEKISNPDVAPRFEDWKVINAQALVTGRVTLEADG